MRSNIPAEPVPPASNICHDFVDRLPHVSVAVDVDECDLRVTRQTADPVAEPFAGDEDRAADVESERVVLERRAVAVAHQEADQALVGGVHLGLAPCERHASAVHDRQVVGHHVVEAHEAVVEDARCVVGGDVGGHGHGSRTLARISDGTGV